MRQEQTRPRMCGQTSSAANTRVARGSIPCQQPPATQPSRTPISIAISNAHLERNRRVPMTAPRAGLPALPADLVDLTHLVTAYYAEHPDPGEPAQRVTFGTSGHRGSSLTASFNEDHIASTSQAICEYRAANGIDGPLFLGADTHALS